MGVSNAVSVSDIKHVWLGYTGTVREHFPLRWLISKSRADGAQRMYVVTCCVSYCCLALYTTGTRGNFQWKSVSSWKAVQLLPGCYLHGMLTPFVPLAVKAPKIRQIRKYARLKAYNLTWNWDFLQTDIRQILVWTPNYSIKFLYGTLAATPNFSVAPSLHYHFSAVSSTVNHLSTGPSQQYHILVWPPPYISKH